jgi:hypothetical protein
VSQHEYEVSKAISRSDPPFYALIMAALRQADHGNYARLCDAFPATARELVTRYNAPGGVLPQEQAAAGGVPSP